MVTAPDGLIMHCYGPCAGRLNDLNILDDSRLLRAMAELPGKPSAIIAALRRFPLTFMNW